MDRIISFFRSSTLFLLASLAEQVIKRHRPFIIGITGTVGKTTSTHFVYDFLHTLYGDRVYMSPYNYNGEFGVPLTILQAQSPYKNPFLWMGVFIRGILLLFTRSYPRYLVLEYGIDHAGEMDFMIEIAPPDVAIILNISKNHIKSFPDFSQYVKEKLSLASAAKKVIFNRDDRNILPAIEKLSEKEIFSYGIRNKDGDVFANNIRANLEDISFSLNYKGEVHDMSYPLIGEYQVYNILPVFALGISLGLDIPTIRERLTDIHPQKGRGSILKGVRESVIIDGSYNGGVNSISGGIEYLDGLEGPYNKILFLGDMRELGDETKALHIEIAEKIIVSSMAGEILQEVRENENSIKTSEILENPRFSETHEKGGNSCEKQVPEGIVAGATLNEETELGTRSSRFTDVSVVLVGEEMQRTVYPLLLKAFGEERVFSFLSSRVAGKKVRDLIMNSPEDLKSIVFVKGSQNSIYLEEGIKEFLYDLRDIDKLCRQSNYWMGKKNNFFETVIAEI